ncbi:HAMP domain-containing sensor histidine kinase [Hyalangium sp.]|uniref:sensor histidine kinase n=1 Tax=Hyalangium sp. TaxID=2028555 RepID=UPI002D5BC3C8|nr:HAMP domain-containing sensor histidine kinase [Hyalangium sp.]HYH97920.1 HAMP domain-containing sensor histidine kinase [Hyalangium sp.]
MSRTSSERSGPEEPDARVPPKTRAKGFLEWLDGFLSEELRQAPLGELGRSRVVAGTAMSLLLLASLFTAAFLVVGMPWSYVVAGGSSAAGYVGTLWLLRRASSSRSSALLLCGIMSSGVILTALYENDSYFSTNAAMMLITILTVYLLGPRPGLVILVPVVLIVGAGHPLWRHFVGSKPRATSEGFLLMMHFIAALCILAGWALGWLYSTAHEATHAALEQDIKARKEAEAKLGELHRTLLDVSRKAGMTEIATGVLHNVGNTLNSVNISVSVVTERLRGSRIPKLLQATEMLCEHAADLGAFLSTDPRGAKLPAYLSALSMQLADEREALLTEMQALGESVEHIKSIVSMQQQHAQWGGLMEQVQVAQLINDALRLQAGALDRLDIEVEREYAEVPPIVVDRHKLLQILLNLLSNARHALVESRAPDKRLSIRVKRCAERERLCIEVGDNGVGIAQENLTRVFAQGFTTKKSGHGFGLHISALAAAEMKGRLSVRSAGPGHGATFTIELPFQSEEQPQPTTPGMR